METDRLFMTNQELQNIIRIGDICIINGFDERWKFLGYEKCKWQEEQWGNKLYDACGVCKGRMIFENVKSKTIHTGCHSITTSKGNVSNVEIIIHNEILEEELFEI